MTGPENVSFLCRCSQGLGFRSSGQAGETVWIDCERCGREWTQTRVSSGRFEKHETKPPSRVQPEIRFVALGGGAFPAPEGRVINTSDPVSSKERIRRWSIDLLDARQVRPGETDVPMLAAWIEGEGGASAIATLEATLPSGVELWRFGSSGPVFAVPDRGSGSPSGRSAIYIFAR